MSSSFEIVVSRTGIGEIARINQFASLEYVLVENDIGALTLVLPDVYTSDLFQTDTILEVYRTLDGITTLEGETVWFVRETRITLDTSGQWLFTVVAFDAKHLLKRRIVMSYAGSSQASKTDNADDVMREIVREQLGASAAADGIGPRRIIAVEANTSSYASMSKAFAFRNVFEVVKDIAESLVGQEFCSFHVAKDVGAFNDLIFRVRRGGWGVDRTQSSGDAVIFSPENGALSDVQIVFDAREEATVGEVGGPGEGENRTLGLGYAPKAMVRSYWNRIEIFVDARNTTGQISELASELSAALYERLARYRFNGTVQQTQDLEYGVEYFWGDTVVASAHGLTFDVHLSKVHVRADANGETIGIQVSSERLLV